MQPRRCDCSVGHGYMAWIACSKRTASAPIRTSALLSMQPLSGLPDKRPSRPFPGNKCVHARCCEVKRKDIVGSRIHCSRRPRFEPDGHPFAGLLMTLGLLHLSRNGHACAGNDCSIAGWRAEQGLDPFTFSANVLTTICKPPCPSRDCFRSVSNPLNSARKPATSAAKRKTPKRKVEILGVRRCRTVAARVERSPAAVKPSRSPRKPLRAVSRALPVQGRWAWLRGSGCWMQSAKPCVQRFGRCAQGLGGSRLGVFGLRVTQCRLFDRRD